MGFPSGNHVLVRGGSVRSDTIVIVWEINFVEWDRMEYNEIIRKWPYKIEGSLIGYQFDW